MTTATLHADVQRSRFVQHLMAAFANLLPPARRATPARLVAADEAAREAQKVRALAHRYAKTDPGFSADLYAAASRHEAPYAD